MVVSLGSATTGAPDAQLATAAALATASIHAGAGRTIFVGVATGVLVWTVTRLLDRAFGLSQ